MGRAASSSDPAAEVSQGPACARRAASTPPPEARISSFVITIACSPVTSPRAALKSASTGLWGERQPPLAGLGSGTPPLGPGSHDGGHPTGHRTVGNVAHVAEPLEHVLLGAERSEERTPQPSQRYLLAPPLLDFSARTREHEGVRRCNHGRA